MPRSGMAVVFSSNRHVEVGKWKVMKAHVLEVFCLLFWGGRSNSMAVAVSGATIDTQIRERERVVYVYMFVYSNKEYLCIYTYI